MGSYSKDDDIEELEIVEADPTGRYIRYNEILGEGSNKTVYKGFDEVNGLEIAWSKIKLSDKVFKSKKLVESVCSEANLLKSLKHENIMRCFHSWVDNESKTVNMITELFTSGNMSQYRKKHNLVNKKAIRNWAKQILKGLDYLHSQNPPIIHKHLRCDNIFVNGNSGKVKIGDIGLATMVQLGSTARAAGSMPEFMAPELCEEEYDQLVDIYSFGMCLLQMVTRELPYSECRNSCQIYKKVCSGIKPAVLNKVSDPQVKQFIEKCLSPVSERPSADELLNDPFLAASDSGSSATSSIMSLSSESLGSSSTSDDQMSAVEVVKSKNEFKLQGKMTQNKESVSMSLWIGECGNKAKKVQFEFILQTDTVESVMEEMAKELELSANDAALITKLMEELITDIVPGYKSSSSELHNVDQQIKLPESPCVRNQDEAEQDSADRSLLDDLKTNDSSGSTGNDTSMSGFLCQTLSNNCQDKPDSKCMRRDRRRYGKEVVKARFKSLRKLLFFCGSSL
ncbi:putative serine/threonine-protein kinase WNK4 [Bienertia sinuspersici]